MNKVKSKKKKNKFKASESCPRRADLNDLVWRTRESREIQAERSSKEPGGHWNEMQFRGKDVYLEERKHIWSRRQLRISTRQEYGLSFPDSQYGLSLRRAENMWVWTDNLENTETFQWLQQMDPKVHYPVLPYPIKVQNTMHSKNHMRETPRKQAAFPVEKTSRNATGDVHITRLQIGVAGWISLRFSARRTNGNSDRILLNYQWMINGVALTITTEYKTSIMRRSCLSELNEK